MNKQLNIFDLLNEKNINDNLSILPNKIKIKDKLHFGIVLYLFNRLGYTWENGIEPEKLKSIYRNNMSIFIDKNNKFISHN